MMYRRGGILAGLMLLAWGGLVACGEGAAGRGLFAEGAGGEPQPTGAMGMEQAIAQRGPEQVSVGLDAGATERSAGGDGATTEDGAVGTVAEAASPGQAAPTDLDTPTGSDGAGAAGVQTQAPMASGVTPNDLPRPSSICPKLTEGIKRFAGVDVNLMATGPAGVPGPIILYWHGTGSSASLTLPRAVGEEGLQTVRQAGGLVVGFVSGQTSGQNTSGNNVWNTGDMDIADEVVACAIEAGVADTRHIHSLGMSAGGLMTTSFSYARANYLASVVTYSGGHVVLGGFDSTASISADPANLFAALIFHGGSGDVVVIPFKAGSEAYHGQLRDRGHLAVICDHGGGHSIPDATGVVWQFFMDHPYKRAPSPYALELPPGFPEYCESP